LNHSLRKLKPMTLLILVSDFIILPNKPDMIVKMASEKFDLIGIMIRDPVDQSMPKVKGQILLKDPNTGEAMVVEPTDVAPEYDAEAKKEIREIGHLFSENNAEFLKLITTEKFIEPVIRMFTERRAKWRV